MAPEMNKSIFREFLGYLKTHAVWWLVPVAVLLVTIGILVLLGSGSSLSPFLYRQY